MLTYAINMYANIINNMYANIINNMYANIINNMLLTEQTTCMLT